jgi:3-oxoacyl-[acyl-carrier-protein] synthase III
MGTRRYSRFTGSGSYIPTRTVENRDFLENAFFRDYGQPIDPADNAFVIDKFREITDISGRRYAAEDHNASCLGAAAADAAIVDAGIDRETLDHLIVAHNFGDVDAATGRLDFCPTLAARIKERLGIHNPRCVAYDLPFGCPGWLQAVIHADYFLRSGDAHRALVVGAETLSRVCDPGDRDSMLYADGAGAVVVEAAETETPVGVLSHVTRSDAVGYTGLLSMGKSYDPCLGDDRRYLKMKGRQLYQYAVRTVPAVIKESLVRAGLTLLDVTKVFIHQANAKLDEAILRRLFKLYGVAGIPERIMPMTISWLGNSSVATLPTLLDLVRKGSVDGHRLSPGDVLVFAAVGAGMNVNSLVYRCP